jgi:4,5-dihydroxyphthalate decarboxylase
VISSPNSDLAAMLGSGEIDAAIGVGAVDAPDIKPLFPDAGAADAAWFNRTGVYPISHMLVVKNDQLERHPWLAEELFALFKTAKRPYVESLHSGAAFSRADQALLAMSKLVGDDPIPYGFEGARKTLETFVGFNVDQRVIPQCVDPKELFAPTTLGLS